MRMGYHPNGQTCFNFSISLLPILIRNGFMVRLSVFHVLHLPGCFLEKGQLPVYPISKLKSLQRPKLLLLNFALLLMGVGLMGVFSGPARAQIPSLHRYSLKEGLPQSEVSSLFEDSRGFIWIGTRGGGLVQFDGYKLKAIKPKTDPGHQFIGDVAELPDGRMVIGNTYGGVSIYNNRVLKTSKGVPNFDQLQRVLMLGEDVYLVGKQAIYAIKGKTDSLVPVYNYGYSISRISAALSFGDRWVLSASDSGLLVMDTKLPARTLLLHKTKLLRNQDVVGIHALDRTHVVLISSRGEIGELDFSIGWGVFSGWRPNPEVQLLPSEKLVSVVFGIGQKLKWMATTEGRILSPSQEALDLKLVNEGLVPEISCLLLDRNENLWIGTEGGGVFMKNKSLVLNYNNFPLLHTNYLKAIYKMQDGTLLAGGTKTGLVALRKSNSGPVQTLYLPGQSIFSFSENQKHLLVGTEKSFKLLDKKTFKPQKEFEVGAKVITLKSGPDKSTLVGTYGNGVWMLDSNLVLKRISKPDQKPQYVYGFESIEGNNQLIPSNSGLWKLNWADHSLQKLITPDSVGDLFFMSTKDRYGTLWFSVPDGLAGYRDGKWYRIRSHQGISSLLIYTLNADEYGNLWVGTNAGIDQIKVDESGRMVQIKNYGPAEGYEGYEANMRASHLSKGELLVGTIEGLFQIPIGKSTLDPLPPKPIISSVSVHSVDGLWRDSLDGNAEGWFFTPPSGFSLPDANRGVAFTFKAINPKLAGKIVYSYRLLGLNEVWTKPTSDDKAIYVGLKGRDFTFQVRSTYDGISFSEPVSYQFSIPKAWYQSFWFTALLVVAGAILLVFIFAGVYKGISQNTYFSAKSNSSNRLSQTLLLLALLFHPISYYFSPLGESGHFIARLIFIVNISTVSLLFILTLLSRELRRKSFLFIQITFILFMVSKATSVYISQLSPYYVVSYLFVAVLGYLIMDHFWKIILFGGFLISFSLFCHFQIFHPYYHPILFTSANLLVFVLLMLTHLNKKRHDTRLEFSNTVVNTGPILVLGFQKNGNLIFSSSNVFELLGYHDFEVQMGMWWAGLVQSTEEVDFVIGKLKNGSESPFQVRMKKKNGSHGLFRFNIREINEQVSVLMGQDVTEAQALESKFEHLVQNAPDCIYQTDFYGTIVYANPQTAFLLGLSQAELVGRRFHEFIREDKRKEVMDFYTRQFRDNIGSTYNEYPMVTQSGNIRWLGFQVVMLNRTAEQDIEGYIAIGRDITERLEAEQLIQHQHKNITDSLSYASRIKQALLPDEKALKDFFTEAACLNRPKDIIGGDFFWLARSGKRQVFVLGDCTGHGVPGAFMTTIAVGLLRQIVREDLSRNCEEVLAIFNKTLSKLLATNGAAESNDFVEMGLCFIDQEANEMEFISSGIGLHVVRNGQMVSHHNGSRGLNYKLDYKGMAETISFQSDDKFFLFSDGLFDQIGGDSQKRFTRQRLLDLIQSNASRPLEEMVEIVKTQADQWKGDLPQIDDQLVVAFRI